MRSVRLQGLHPVGFRFFLRYGAYIGYDRVGMSSSADQHGMFSERGGIMEGIRAYLLSVTAAALVCAVIRSMTEHAGTGAGLIRLLSGVPGTGA